MLSSIGFTELPSSVNVTAGDEAVFRCQHSDAEFIGWRVNSMPFRQTSVPGVSQGTDGSLTILALPENNGTLVECVALFTDGTLPISSPPAILVVQGKNHGIHSYNSEIFLNSNEFHYLVSYWTS